jgi:hypothetical protein
MTLSYGNTTIKDPSLSEKYEAMKIIPPGAIVFVWGHSLISKIIRWYQKWETKIGDTPSHCQVYLGMGARQCVSAEWNGVRYVPLLLTNKRVEIYSVPDLTIDELQELKAYLCGSIGKGYDGTALIGILRNMQIFRKIITNKIKEDQFKNFCSELVCEAFRYIKKKVSKKKVCSQTTPADIWLKAQKEFNWVLSYA